MTVYHGNGAYCYANSTSMLLSTIGEDISPSLVEVITGFALGASLERNNMLFFDACTSSPDKGVNRAFEILGFSVTERVSADTDSIPLEQLRQDLLHSPVLLGPFDMGYLTYNPNHLYQSGCDHYVLALAMDDKEIWLHDPAGFPYVTLTFEQLERTWRAERITWSSGSYRSWVSPRRVANPTMDEIYSKAIQLFKANYADQKMIAGKEGRPVGKQAIRTKADQFRNESVSIDEINHLTHFAFPVSTRRALDFSAFFKGRHAQLSALKNSQAQLFGKCQSLASSKKWVELAIALERLADTEEEIESAIDGLLS